MALLDEAAPRLLLPPGPRFAAIGAEFIRGAGVALGLEPPLAERLALIAEEVLAAAQPAAGAVALAPQDRLHAVRLEVDFGTTSLDLAGLDQSRERDPEDAAGVGLYIAARLADRLATEPLRGGGLRLAFEVDRRYAARMPPPPPEGLGSMSGPPLDPDAATLALLVDWAEATGTGGPAFRTAARVLDRRAGGELFARAALDARQRPVGGLFWQPFGRRLMALSGPALLLPEGPARREVAAALLDAALAGLVRGTIQGLVVLEPAPEMPATAFEVVGHLPHRGGTHPVLFRALEEDPGRIAWVPAPLRDWVAGRARGLGLGRDIEAPPPPARATGAALAAETDRAAGRVTLRPLLAARDAAAVALANVALFRTQGFADLRAVLDLGQPDQAAFGEGLVQAGLAPAALIPDAAGDLLLLAAPA
jgi:anti-sigma regulatory factor (Ser/Thr protein kinase)